MSLRIQLREWLRRRGYDLHRYALELDPAERRRRMLASARIDLVLDVGANEGQYAMELRKLGYTGRIVSFEPIREVGERLQAGLGADRDWEFRGMALGSSDGAATLQVGAESATSSLLKPSEYLVNRAAHARSVRSEEVRVARLDTVFEPSWGGRRIWLKLDTQGFEMEVLRGATESLPKVRIVQLELSLRPLYEGEPAFLEVAHWLAGRGFGLVGLEPGFVEASTGRLLQSDVFFASRVVFEGGDDRLPGKPTQV
ncbi:MAG: FkbM family methyltransferase [Limisphaerales bacterium]